MIQFKISAPDALTLFGEHAKKGLMASINLRTTLTFNELPISLENNIIINFPQFYLFYKVPLQEFLKLYNNCDENIELLQDKVLQYTSDLYIPANQRVIMQAFYYLLAYITCKEQIKIKSFNIFLYTEFLDKELVCPASCMVCLAACLFHWSRVQKGICDNFNYIDRDKIRLYVTRCKEIFPEFRELDVFVCIYSSMVEYHSEKVIYITSLLNISNVAILLVDSKQIQNLDAQKQRVAELINMFPDIANPIFNDIDIVTNMACNALLNFYGIYENKELNTKIKNNFLLQQHEKFETSIRKIRKLLQLLYVSHHCLDRIYEIAQRFGFSGKYVHIGNDKIYAYIWCPILYTNARNFAFLSNELKLHGFNVTTTNLTSIGVTVE